ncbi:MAG: hypothetical protein O7G86_16060, partial [Gammaproteobacteria bacterium]|nr:hypothetical protein [Gammaproteobacteria bacterium]
NDCFVAEVLVNSGSVVEKNTPLLRCRDINLTTRQTLLDARMEGLRLEYEGYRLREAVKRKLITEDIAALKAERDLNKSRVDDLIVQSKVDGVFVVRDNKHLVDRFFRQGETIGFIINGPVMSIRTAVSQARVDLVRKSTKTVQVRFARDIDEIHETRIAAEIPASTRRLPSAALGSRSGGKVLVDPNDPEGTQAMEDLFLFDVRLPERVTPTMIGGRVYVRFNHGSETISEQLFRNVRLLFLRQFDV